VTWSRTSQLIARAAEALGVACTSVGSEHSDWLLRLATKDRAVIVSKTRSPFLTQVAQTLANHKLTSRELIAAVDVPTVPALLVDDTGDPRGAAVRAMLDEHRRVTVKPNWGNRARGVVTDVADLDACARAIELARALDLDEEALVEPHVEGINMRVAVIGGRFAAACEIARPRIVGDGERTFAQLVARLADDPRRSDWRSPALVSFDAIELDEDALAVLDVQGVREGEVLPPGRAVELVGEEAETIDRTDELHPSWAAAACRACARLGVDVGGVDLRGPAERFREPAPVRWRPGEACLLEVNVLPALHVHALPSRGQPRPVFEALVAYCLSLPGAPAPCAVVRAVE
jgi:D-alanine-D-alanine ligase-like ATP-grasp enzyme